MNKVIKYIAGLFNKINKVETPVIISSDINFSWAKYSIANKHLILDKEIMLDVYVKIYDHHTKKTKTIKKSWGFMYKCNEHNQLYLIVRTNKYVDPNTYYLIGAYENEPYRVTRSLKTLSDCLTYKPKQD
jgi:hypothetical protein